MLGVKNNNEQKLTVHPTRLGFIIILSLQWVRRDWQHRVLCNYTFIQFLSSFVFLHLCQDPPKPIFYQNKDN